MGAADPNLRKHHDNTRSGGLARAGVVVRRPTLPAQATRLSELVGLRGQCPGEDQSSSWEEPAVVAIGHHWGLGLLRNATSVTAGGEVHQANTLD